MVNHSKPLIASIWDRCVDKEDLEEQKVPSAKETNYIFQKTVISLQDSLVRKNHS